MKDGLDAGQTRQVAVLNNKIEALQVLARALLKEIETLRSTPTLESGRDIKLRDEVHRFEAEMIRCALIRTGGRQRRAARLLNTNIATLHAKIKRYNLDTDEVIEAASNLRRHTKAK